MVGIHIAFHENTGKVSTKSQVQLYYSENNGNETHSPLMCMSGGISHFEKSAWKYMWHYFESEGVLHLIPVQLVRFYGLHANLKILKTVSSSEFLPRNMKLHLAMSKKPN